MYTEAALCLLQMCIELQVATLKGANALFSATLKGANALFSSPVCLNNCAVPSLLLSRGPEAHAVACLA